MLAMELKVKGLMNLQLALKDGEIFVLEVNPRASRTVPFVSKAIGVPLAKVGARVMAGKTLREIGFTEEVRPAHVSVKEAVFPFIKFPGVDVLLGPEMKSTGEVMGIDLEFGPAFLKSQYSTEFPIPAGGNVFLSVADRDKAGAVIVGRRLKEWAFFRLHGRDGRSPAGCRDCLHHSRKDSRRWYIGRDRPHPSR
jgi:carbamoyl-phosphate synthase large subunit